MARSGSALLLLSGAAGILAAFAPPPRLPSPAYDWGEAVVTLGGLPVRPGEQYPPSREERALSPAVAPPPTPAPRASASGPDWRLAVDVSATVDSNYTNGTRLDAVAIDYGEGPLPVPLDPALRKKSGIGAGVSVAGGVRLPIAPGIALAGDVEGYAVDYSGERGDDASALVATGLEFGSAAAPDGSVEVLAFDRWYGGAEAMKGLGLRANYRLPLGAGQNLRLAVDGRIFDSAYGEAFGGKEGSLYLAWDKAVTPALSVSAGAWVHRQWAHDDAFSYTDWGAYGGLSHYLSTDLMGGFSAGAGRTRFDAPFLLLGPERRSDWRLYGTAWISTRRPVALGLTPSLTYTYNRTSSSIPFYANDRHRLRFGLGRKF